MLLRRFKKRYVLGIGSRPSPFNVVNSERVEFFCDTNLVVDTEGNAFSLRSVSQSRIVDHDLIRIHIVGTDSVSQHPQECKTLARRGGIQVMQFGGISSTFSHQHLPRPVSACGDNPSFADHKSTAFKWLALPLDGYGSADPGRLIKTRSLGLRHTDTPVRRRVARKVTRVETDAPDNSQKVGHGSTHENRAGRMRVLSEVDIFLYDLPTPFISAVN